jgi:predicted esterase
MLRVVEEDACQSPGLSVGAIHVALGRRKNFFDRLNCYKLTFERGYDAKGRILDRDLSSRQSTELIIKEIKDCKRSIDYLETRPDIDSKRLAYIGFSWGGWLGAIIPAVEDRLKADLRLHAPRAALQVRRVGQVDRRVGL